MISHCRKSRRCRRAGIVPAVWGTNEAGTLPPLRDGSFSRAFILLALVACCFGAWPGSAQAQGIVVQGDTAGQAGWQIDALQAMPAPQPQLQAAPVITSAPARSYVVQRGDTLSGIATKLGIGQSVLAALNNLTSPDQLKAGQTLIVEDAPPAPVQAPALPAGSPLNYMRFYPWPPVQGQTVTLWWRAETPVTLTVRLGDQTFPSFGSDRQGWVLIPVGPLAPVGTTPLVLTSGQLSFTLPFAVAAGNFQTDVVPAETADPILTNADKVKAETARMTALFAMETLSGWMPASRFHSPLKDEYDHTSPFGTRRTYGTSQDAGLHWGEDFAAPPGTPVLAPAPGTVVLAEPLFVRGNAVVIDHGHGVLTGYWHMQKLNVKAGDRVATGQQLGEVGSTGLSTGPHLHWELRVHGVGVDPLQWLAK
jgi:murein DD-endopeptidase MepM/ murein hydrolase activator NlpD